MAKKAKSSPFPSEEEQRAEPRFPLVNTRNIFFFGRNLLYTTLITHIRDSFKMLGDNFRFLMSLFPIEEPLGYTNDGYPD